MPTVTPSRAASAAAAVLLAILAAAALALLIPVERPAPPAISGEDMLRMLRAEDTRQWSSSLENLLRAPRWEVRRRAALAAGRIGDAAAVAPLARVIESGDLAAVRAMAAFALGEIESVNGIPALTGRLAGEPSSDVRGRILEALGKIAAPLPAGDERKLAIGAALLEAVGRELDGPKLEPEAVLPGLTAILRAAPAGAGSVLGKALEADSPRVRADAENVLARMRIKESGPRLRELLRTDPDPIVRANAARALGAAEDAASFDDLAERAAADPDSRVRVSAIRAVALLENPRGAEILVRRGESLLDAYRTGRSTADHPPETAELLEVAAALGRQAAGTGSDSGLDLIRRARAELAAPEIEIAFAQLAGFAYMSEPPYGAMPAGSGSEDLFASAARISALAAGIGEIAAMAGGQGNGEAPRDARRLLAGWLDDPRLPTIAAPDVLRAYAAFKQADFPEVLYASLQAGDVILRATAAELLGGMEDGQIEPLLFSRALEAARLDSVNDASLAILDAMDKHFSKDARDIVRSALDSSDYLVRRRAAEILRSKGESAGAGRLETRNRTADYSRALSRLGTSVRAAVRTEKGDFTLELLPDEAPLTVDNFIQLAGRGFFDGLTFHRVVPNFVIQGGDPRGDGNGGPGYQIRCEINMTPYDRGAVGMALSGKDTGGSQWFVTHSPQPHLDGGYTVFARVVDGMEVVDRIVRGDRIRTVRVTR